VRDFILELAAIVFLFITAPIWLPIAFALLGVALLGGLVLAGIVILILIVAML
jgi:hypothetical protein